MTVYGTTATRDRQGWFLGLTGPQLVALLMAAFPCWLAMASGRWVALLLLGPAWVVLAAMICLPIHGWSAYQWLGILVRHVIGSALGWSRFQSRAAAGDLELAPDRNVPDEAGWVDGVSADGAFTGGAFVGGASAGGVEADLPGILSGIRIHDGPPMSGPLRPAIIQDAANRTWAATARITHPGIGMSDEDDRALMGAGLAELCEAATAGGQLHLIAVQVRTVPDDGTERGQWVRENLRGRDPDVAVQINAQLDTIAAGAAVRREAFVTVAIGEDTITRSARRAGRGVAGRARLLYSLLAEVESRLTGAIGCTRVAWMDTAELAVAIRTGFEPGDAPALADAALQHRRDDSIAAGIPLGAAGPAHASTAIRSYRHGDWESVSSTVLLPRKGARMGALARALVPSQPGERRSLTVFFRPISQQAAERSTGRAEMSAAMGAEMRRKVGRTDRARDRRALGQLHERDEKLERGRSLVKVSAVVAVTIPAHWDTLDYGRRLDASVRMCGYAPMPLDGAHDAAFAAAAIPLGCGLVNRRRS